ncbi:MAG: MBL fold metallo-hydrolase [Candidatus Spechtbacterales bacterium]
MVITWYGQSCFKIQSGQLTVVIDPFDKSIGLTPPKFEAQMVLTTHDHFDHNNISTIKGDYFVVDGPGEYEYGGIRVRGIRSYHDNSGGEERGLNTIYVVTIEDINLLHMGDIGQDKLTEEQLDVIGEVDILMVPVGGNFTVDGEKALDISNQVEPKIVIPMHYKLKGLKPGLDDVSGFLKAIGKTDVTAEEKLTIKKKDLPDPENKMEVVVLKI